MSVWDRNALAGRKRTGITTRMSMKQNFIEPNHLTNGIVTDEDLIPVEMVNVLLDALLRIESK